MYSSTPLKTRAPGEDRTHDLQISLWSTWIMRLTRCLLRYRGRCNPEVLMNGSISGTLGYGHVETQSNASGGIRTFTTV